MVESIDENNPNIDSESLPFQTVIGQAGARLTLFKALSSDRLAHAYLFVGLMGTGRSALALDLARVTNCPKGAVISAQEGCDCKSCRNMLRWQHPNLNVLFPLPPSDKEKGAATDKALEEIVSSKALDPYAPLKITGSGRILIDQVRQLRNRLALTSDSNSTRVIIIQPADRMTDESANALLKLLEEPPEGSCLLLLTESLRSILPTIVSRCQVVNFAPVSNDDIAYALHERKKLSKEEAESIARLAFGSYTRALGLLEGDIRISLEAGLEFLRAATVGNAEKVGIIVDNWSRDGSRTNAKELLTYMAVWLKDALIWKVFPPDEARMFLLTSGQHTVIERIAELYQPDQLSHAWCAIEDARSAVDSNAGLNVIYTVLAIKIHRILQ